MDEEDDTVVFVVSDRVVTGAAVGNARGVVVGASGVVVALPLAFSFTAPLSGTGGLHIGAVRSAIESRGRDRGRLWRWLRTTIADFCACAHRARLQSGRLAVSANVEDLELDL